MPVIDCFSTKCYASILKSYMPIKQVVSNVYFPLLQKRIQGTFPAGLKTEIVLHART